MGDHLMRITQEQYLQILARQAPKLSGTTSDSVKIESELHAQIEEFLIGRGWLYFHGRMDKPTGRTPGEPDFHICAPAGKYIMVEAKAKNNKPTTKQMGVMCWAKKLGHIYVVVWNFDQFLKALRDSGISW
jgi:hypothetical protein